MSKNQRHRKVAASGSRLKHAARGRPRDGPHRASRGLHARARDGISAAHPRAPAGRRRHPVAAKLDLFKKHRAEYVTPRKPALVTVGPARYLTAEGRGAPAGVAFQAAVGALFAVAFTIKMTRKGAGKGDYKVAALEGLWWGPDKRAPFAVKSPKDWHWKVLIRTPVSVAAADLARAR